MASNYTVRLNADTSKHNQALKQSANQVYQYSKRVDNAKKSLNNLAKTLAPLAGTIGIAGGALTTFKTAITSTETGVDNLAREIETLKTSVNGFFSSLTNGVGIQGFLQNLNDIKKAAKEAYNALDDLGTAEMWKTARKNQLQAEIDEATVVVNSNTVSADEKKKAQALIKLNTDKIKALNGELIDLTSNAYYAVLKKLAGGGSGLGATELDFLMRQREAGTLNDYISNWDKKYKNTKTWVQDGTSITGATFGHYENTYSEEWAKRWASQMKSFAGATDAQIQEALDLQNQISQMRSQQAQQERKNNKQIQKDVEGRGSKTPTTNEDKKEPTTPNSVRWYNEQIKALTTEQENLNMATIEGEDRYNEINAQVRDLKENLALLTGQIEPATDELKEYKEWWEKNTEVTDEFFNNYLKGIANLRGQKYADVIEQFNGIADAVESVGSVFGALGDVIGESGNEWLNFTQKAVQGIGVVIEQAGKLVAVEQANAIASGVAQGAKEPFPANLVAISTILSTLLSIFASMPKFATGGIVGGTTVGDYNLARVNGGEMILNQREQRRLFSVLSSGATLTNDNSNNSVTFRVSGNDLIGVLNNYNNKRNRVR